MDEGLPRENYQPPLVAMPDVSAAGRTEGAPRPPVKALSKSEINVARFCEIAAFFRQTQKRDQITTADMTFGSGLDKAIELAITALRADQPIPVAKCLAVAAEKAQQDENEINLDEIEDAVHQFGIGIAPHYDWSHALLQHHIRLELNGIGDCDGYLDLVLPDLIVDVKTGKRAKSESDIYFTSELPFYAMLRERETGIRPKKVGYFTWLRLKKPLWQPLVVDVTDDLIAEGLTHARRQMHLRKFIDTVAQRGADPTVFFSGPRFDTKCLDCQYVDLCEVGQRRVARLKKEEGLAA